MSCKRRKGTYRAVSSRTSSRGAVLSSCGFRFTHSDPSETSRKVRDLSTILMTWGHVEVSILPLKVSDFIPTVMVEHWSHYMVSDEMDDGIELNLATPTSGPSATIVRRQAVQKGGRWTDRYVSDHISSLGLTSVGKCQSSQGRTADR